MPRTVTPLPLFAPEPPDPTSPPLLLLREAGGSHALGRAADYVAAALALGWPGVVAANVGTLLGSIDLYVAARTAGLPALIGIELPLRVGEEVPKKRTVIPPTPLLLLAHDAAGWHSLLELARLAANPGWAVDLEQLRQSKLTVISLGLAQAVLAGKHEQLAVARTLAALKQAVAGAVYAALPTALVGMAGTKVAKQAAELDLPTVALHEARYVHPDDAPAYAALLILHNQPHDEAAYHIAHPDEAAAHFSDHPASLHSAANLWPSEPTDLWPPYPLAGIEANGQNNLQSSIFNLQSSMAKGGRICRIVPGERLAIEYAPGSEEVLLACVAAQWPQAVLLTSPATTSPRVALREAAQSVGAAELTALLDQLHDTAFEASEWGELTGEAAQAVTLARKLVARPRWGEVSGRSLLLPAKEVALPLHVGKPLPTLTISRTAAAALGAVRIDLRPNPALDLLEQVAGATISGELDRDDAATWQLIAAGEADLLDGWDERLAAARDWAELTARLGERLGLPANDLLTLTAAEDNYRLAYAQAHDPAAYYAAAAPAIGASPLRMHRAVWVEAVADGRLVSSPLVAEPQPLRLLGLLRGLRRQFAADSSVVLTGWLDDLAGSSRVVAFEPLAAKVQAHEGQPVLLLGRALQAQGQVVLFVEDVSPFSGEVPPLPTEAMLVQPPRPAPRSGGDMFAAAGVAVTPPEPPAPPAMTTPPASGNGKPGKGKPEPTPAPVVTVRRLHLRLPVSDETAADIELAQRVARLARQHTGPDKLLLYLRVPLGDVHIEPIGCDVDAEQFAAALRAALGDEIIFAADQVEREVR